MPNWCATYYIKSADTIDWLEKMGVVFAEPASYFPGAHFTWHLVQPESGGKPGPTAGATMTKILTNKARELGVKVMLQTPVKKILKQGDKITGVIAEDGPANRSRPMPRSSSWPPAASATTRR